MLGYYRSGCARCQILGLQESGLPLEVFWGVLLLGWLIQTTSHLLLIHCTNYAGFRFVLLLLAVVL